MSFFRQPKPRRFHHEPIYYDEHRDRVSKIEQQAKKELGLTGKDEKPVTDDIRGAFSEGVHRRRQRARRGLLSSFSANTGTILVIILVLILVWIYLSK